MPSSIDMLMYSDGFAQDGDTLNDLRCLVLFQHGRTKATIGTSHLISCADGSEGEKFLFWDCRCSGINPGNEMGLH